MRCSSALLTAVVVTAFAYPPNLGRVTAGTIHVPADHATIQAAIDAAVDGDEVIIAPGSYTGMGNRDLDFSGKAITVRSTDPNDPAVVTTTIINCEGSEEDPHRSFTFHSGESGTAVVTGLTITNGYPPLEAIELEIDSFPFRTGGGTIVWVPVQRSPAASSAEIPPGVAVGSPAGIRAALRLPTARSAKTRLSLRAGRSSRTTAARR